MIDSINYAEDDLFRRLEQRDEHAFAYVYKNYYGAILLYAERIAVGDRAIAEDATADAFIELWRGNRYFSGREHLMSFLRKVAHNRCIDRFRLKNKHSEVVNELLYLSEQQQEDLFINEVYLPASLLRRVMEEIEKLPPHTRDVFRLGYIEGLKNAQIAEKLNIKDATVRRRKTEALHQLRKVLKGIDWDMLSLLFTMLSIAKPV